MLQLFYITVEDKSMDINQTLVYIPRAKHNPSPINHNNFRKFVVLPEPQNLEEEKIHNFLLLKLGVSSSLKSQLLVRERERELSLIHI